MAINLSTQVFTQQASDQWLYSKSENGQYVGGRIEMVKLFGMIAAFILLIACINFMNLSTARSEKRAKEVGIRKVVGAQKSRLGIAVYWREYIDFFDCRFNCCIGCAVEFAGI